MAIDLDEMFGSNSNGGTRINLDKLFGPIGTNDDDNIIQAAWHGIASATGNAIHTGQDALTRVAKPEYMSDEEWQASQPGLVKKISQFGRELEDEHKRDYSAWSPNRLTYGVAGVVPYAAGLGVTTAAATRSGNYQMIGQLANQSVRNAGAFGKYTQQVAKVAEAVTPAATVGAIRTVPEAGLEWQGAYDDYIADAKREGTYIKGDTEKRAEEVSDAVFRDNMALLGGTNLLETLSIATKLPMSKVKSAVTKIMGGAATNAGEEMAQQIIPKFEGGKNWSLTDEDVLEAGLIGAIAGGGMQGGGMIADRYLGDGTESTYTPQQNSISSGNTDIDGYINSAASAYNIDPALIHAVAQIESNYNPGAVSEAGAQGVMQLMPDTAKGLGVEDSLDPQQNINGGAKYLAQCLQETGGDVHQALAMYNGGQGYMNTAEAQAYADKVMGVYGTPSSGSAMPEIDIPTEKYYNILGEVSNTGLTDLTETKLNLLARDFQNQFGVPLDVTSMKRGGDGSSWHDSGQAIDVVSDALEKDSAAREWLIERGKQYGLVALDEYANPSANATGGHIHFSDHGEALQGNVKGNMQASGGVLDDTFQNEFQNDFQDENDYYKYLVDEKVESAVQNNDMNQWNFLSNNVHDKDAIAKQYPDIAEKMQAYRSGTIGRAAQGKIPTKNNESVATDDTIRKAIAYYDRINDPIEKNIIEKLVNDNNVAGLKVMFPFLAENSPQIPKFEPNRDSFIDSHKKRGVNSLVNALNSVAVQKFDNAEKVPAARQQLVNALGGIKRQKGIEANQRKIENTARSLSGINTDTLMKVAYNAADAPMTNQIKQVIGNELVKRGILPPAVAEGVNFDKGMLDIAQKRIESQAGLNKIAMPQKAGAKTTDPQTQARLNALVGDPSSAGIINAINQPNQAALQAMQKMKPVSNKAGVLKTAEEKVTENAFRSAVNRGDYTTAIDLATQMGNFGVADILKNRVKFSFNDRHERDRQRMREQQKATDSYVPEGYRGEASGVVEGMAEHELESVKEDVNGLLKQGISLEQIAKEYKILYNKIKANKSNGMSDKDKIRYLSFLRGAINYVSDKGRNEQILRSKGENGSSNIQGRESEVFRGSDRRGDDGRGLRRTDSQINQNQHSN